MAAVRVRQHVNPLSRKYQTTAEVPDWRSVFSNPDRPLHIDIGCAKGYFLMQMAALQPDWNFLGLEIRAPLVDSALQQRDKDHQQNLHFLFCNANTSLTGLLESLPGDLLQQVSIQFPDPWFKKRHQKRRVVQPELVQCLADFLPSRGRVILQSDVESVAQEMCDRFAEHNAFHRTQPDWLLESPFPAQTDREQLTQEKGLPVYRAIFLKQPSAEPELMPPA
ncbi:MAG: tRNA (guanosine(46)-N7)-methyltransferase TrmB [Leptolyngbya sp. SIO1D8]|nr:tRNA (guanosine(46)-N7)-methyltransferase TrmB [Leptolyngbya sp. SIO1D8]